MVALDGSEYSLSALDAAVDAAASLHAELALCHVVELSRAAVLSGGEAQLVPGCLEELQAQGQALLARAEQRVRDRVPASRYTVEGESVDGILQLCALLRARMIVIGSHGRTGFGRALMGSVAEEVVRRSAVPVMVVRAKRPNA